MRIYFHSHSLKCLPFELSFGGLSFFGHGNTLEKDEIGYQG